MGHFFDNISQILSNNYNFITRLNNTLKLFWGFTFSGQILCPKHNKVTYKAFTKS